MQESAVATNAKPTLNLLLRQTSQALLKATRLARLFCRKPPVQDRSVCVPKSYERPAVRKLTLEQARLLALGHVEVGKEVDSEFMKLLFPDKEEHQ